MTNTEDFPHPFFAGRSHGRRHRGKQLAAAIGMRFFRGRGGPFGGGPFEGRGGRIRRGGITYLVLGTLLEQPRHGYDIMEQFERRRGFRPSPGSIYPVLQMLEEGGYIVGSDVDGKRVFTVTDAGRALYAEHASKGERGDDDDAEPSARATFKMSAIRLTTALAAARGSSDAELEQIAAILDRARREILRLLASEEL
jgi:DNA-binding PadR family transcriptional regulator